MVTDELSLLETAERLGPSLAVVDLSLTRGDRIGWLSRLRERCPDIRVIVLSVHDEPSVQQTVRDAGADGFVLKRRIASELLPAIEAILPSVDPTTR